MATSRQISVAIALFIGLLMYGGNEAHAVLVGDGTRPCAGATINSPNSIQTAVNAATTAGPTTIQVCPGTYTAVSIVNKNNLTLTGGFIAPPPLPPLSPTIPAFDRLSCLNAANPLNDPTQHSVVNGGTAPGVNPGPSAFLVAANNVTISNFTVQGTVNNAGVNLARANSDHKVRGNVIQNNTFGVYFNSNGVTASDVSGNCIRNNNQAGSASGNGVYSDQGLSNALIGQNIVTRHLNASVIMVGASQSNLQISGNEIINDAPIIVINTKNSSISGNSSVNNSVGSGIFFGGNVDHVTVSGNSIERCAFTGINLRDTFVAIPNSNNTITENEVERCGDAGIRIRDGSFSNTVTENETDRSGSEGIGLLDVDGGTNGLKANIVSKNNTKRNGSDGIRLDNAKAQSVLRNDSDRNIGDGLHATSTATGNTISNNRMRRTVAPSIDCRDQSTGTTRTAGTANTWTGNTGATDSPDGICTPKR